MQLLGVGKYVLGLWLYGLVVGWAWMMQVACVRYRACIPLHSVCTQLMLRAHVKGPASATTVLSTQMMRTLPCTHAVRISMLNPKLSRSR